MVKLFLKFVFFNNNNNSKAWYFNYSIMWYIIAAFLALLLLLYIGWRIYLFTVHKVKQIPLQKPQLIDEKYFLTSSQVKLNWNGSINPNGEYIILYVHDLYTDEDCVDSWRHYLNDNKDGKISVCSFHQRWNEQTNQTYLNFNLATTLYDIKQIVEYLNETYPKQKIILQGQGIGATIAIYASFLINNIDKVIAINLISNRKYIKYRFAFKVLLCFGVLFYARKSLILKMDYGLLTNNNQFAINCQKKYGKNKTIALCAFLQLQKMNRSVFKKINKVKQKILIYQSVNDFHYQPNKLEQWFEKVNENVTIVKWEDREHFLLNEKDDRAIIEDLTKWISNN